MKYGPTMKRFLSTALCAGLLTASLPVPRAVQAEEQADKVIALTFDDGPNTTTTNEVLDVLEKYDAVASFFLIGDNINAESAVSVKRAYDMGCEIDNHSKTHSNMPNMTAEEIAAEIQYVDDYVYEITGERTKFFRPPFIDTNQTMYDVIDLPFISGFDCKDYMADVTAQQRADAMITAAKDGLIILLHDAAGNSQTVEALETVIPTLQAQGYEFVTLTELFERQGETPKETLIYSEVAKYPCKDYTFYQNVFTGEAVGDSSWPSWGETSSLDLTELAELSDTYAIEVTYSCPSFPVVVLQRWSGGSLWYPVNPCYYNGEKACFLAKDIQAALDVNGVTYADLDKITVVPGGGTLTMYRLDLLVKAEEDGALKGDVNLDGSITTADLILLQRYLLNTAQLTAQQAQNADLDENDRMNAFDLAALKRTLLTNI